MTNKPHIIIDALVQYRKNIIERINSRELDKRLSDINRAYYIERLEKTLYDIRGELYKLDSDYRHPSSFTYIEITPKKLEIINL